MTRIPISKRDVIVILSDGASHEQEVFMESGNVAWQEGTPEALYFMDRGSIEDGETRDGDDTAMTVSMDFAITDFASDAYATLHGWFTRPEGSWEADNLVSSLGVGRDFRLNVDLVFLGDKRGGVEDYTLRFPHYKPQMSVAEGDFLVASLSGTCKATQPRRL